MCLRALSDQDWQDGDEVVVGLDGPDEYAAALARDAFTSSRCSLRVEQRPNEGYIALRHALLGELRGDILLSLNDDVVPEPGFVNAHRQACERGGGEAAFVGYSPFARVESPTVIDRLVGETPWVFFYDTMLGERDERRDFGFRHLFGLNFSARMEDVRHAGGFASMPNIYGYDDIELGFRLTQNGLAVRFCSEAVAVHDHRMAADSLLKREHALGVSACHYAKAHPAFAEAVFRAEILSAAYLGECERAVRSDRAACDRLTHEFASLDHISGVDAPDISAVLDRFRPLKKHVWRQGLLTEAARLGLISKQAA